MKKKLPRPKARNREHKSRGIGISQAKECPHMWSGGYCLKCGVRQADVVSAAELKDNPSSGGNYEK